MIAIPQSLEPEHIAAIFKEMGRLQAVETAARRFHVAYVKFDTVDIESGQHAEEGADRWNESESFREALFALLPLPDAMP